MWRFRRRWETHWEGHTIVVRNWWTPLLYCGETLIIDGRVADEHSGWGRIASDLQGQIPDDGLCHRVTVHLGSVDGGFRSGCHIRVDDTVVGGDVAKELLT